MIKKSKILLILFFLLSFLSPQSFGQQRETPPVTLEKISDRLFQILGGRGANGGVYIGDNGVLVIDSKMTEESVDQTIAEIRKITDKPIKYLVNTHSDGDHIAGNPYFPKSVIIIAHQNCREEFFHPRRDGKPSGWNDPEMAPYVPSLTYRDKMDIYLGEKKVELRYFGVGHTKGDTVVYFPEEKTAFLGDQMFIGRPQLIHSYKGGNSFEHVKTLTKMLENIDAEKFCSGHSDPVDRNTVEHHIQEMKSIQGKIKSLVEQGKSLEEVKTEFPENHARLVESIFNEIKGMS
jgi:glyoxylase-like metal-dependent hydrolase (beta-lactamase superfamily II)